MCSGAELTDDKDSPLPGARREENEKTREKMQLVRSQMENMSLMKERKVKVCCMAMTSAQITSCSCVLKSCSLVLSLYIAA